MARSNDYLRNSRNTSIASSLICRGFHIVLIFSLAFPNLAAAWPQPGAAPLGLESSATPGPSQTTTKLLSQPASVPTLPPGFNRPQPRIGDRAAINPAVPNATSNGTGAPAMFIENVGQFAVAQGKSGGAPALTVKDKPRFKVMGLNGSVFLSPGALWVTLQEKPSYTATVPSQPAPQLSATPQRGENGSANLNLATPSSGGSQPSPVATPSPDTFTSHSQANVRVSFVGANATPVVEGFDPVDTHISYFTGSDPIGWKTNVPVWAGVRYVDLYSGIDLEVTSRNGQWDWRFVLKNGVDQKAVDILQRVTLRVEGADQLALAGGNVQATTRLGQFALPLLTLQTSDGRSVNSRTSSLAASLNAPQLAETDISAPFQDDSEPAKNLNTSSQEESSGNSGHPNDLMYSTYFGGGGWDAAFGITADLAGKVYVAGQTTSTNMPTTPGAIRSTEGGSFDAVVLKIDTLTGKLLYASYLGGSGNDRATGITVDAGGAIYLTGDTMSSTFPTTTGAYSRTLHGRDAFVTKLSPSGTSILYSTFLGGGGNEFPYAIHLDSNSSVFVGGMTDSNNFPVSANAYRTTFAGGQEGFVAKLNLAGGGASDLVWATYIGGSQADQVHDIAVDASAGTVYAVGQTHSSDFPTTNGSQYGGGTYDMFVVKLNAAGTGASYSLLLGGGGAECEKTGDAAECHIAIDGTGAAYVTTGSDSPDYPTTPGAYQTRFQSNFDAVVTKIKPDGSGLAYSTFLAGSDQDWGWGISVSPAGIAYVAGVTYSHDFPTSTDAFDRNLLYVDAFVSTLSNDGSTLLYSSYFGGSGIDQGLAIAAVQDWSGSVYLAGTTESSDFPLRPGAVDTNYAGN